MFQSVRVENEIVIGRIEEIKSKSELMNDGMDYQSIDKYACILLFYLLRRFVLDFLKRKIFIEV